MPDETLYPFPEEASVTSKSSMSNEVSSDLFVFFDLSLDSAFGLHFGHL